jgi:hypothetical protein
MKKYCTLTPANNPRNEVYKIAMEKTRNKQTLTTLQRPDGTVTETAEETIELMLGHLFPEDDPQKDTDLQKEVRRHGRTYKYGGRQRIHTGYQAGTARI